MTPAGKSHRPDNSASANSADGACGFGRKTMVPPPRKIGQASRRAPSKEQDVLPTMPTTAGAGVRFSERSKETHALTSSSAALDSAPVSSATSCEKCAAYAASASPSRSTSCPRISEASHCSCTPSTVRHHCRLCWSAQGRAPQNAAGPRVNYIVKCWRQGEKGVTVEPEWYGRRDVLFKHVGSFAADPRRCSASAGHEHPESMMIKCGTSKANAGHRLSKARNTITIVLWCKTEGAGREKWMCNREKKGRFRSSNV